MEKLQFRLEDGTTESYFVEEQTVIGGITYLLVSDSLEDEANVFIFRDVSDPASPDACYEIVDDPEVLEAVFHVFQLELEDEDTTLVLGKE